MFRNSLISAIFLVVLASPARAATLLGYWDLNGTMSAYPGMTFTSSITATYFTFGDGYIDFDTDGTTVNRPALDPLPPAGKALAFGVGLDLTGDGYFEITGLDFRNYQDVTFSFAGMKTVAFELFDFFELQYNDGSGWHQAAELSELSTAYAPVTLELGNKLNNVASGGLRLHFVNFLQADAKALFDNIQISATAVPEPGAGWLVGGALVVGFLGWRRLRIA